MNAVLMILKLLKYHRWRNGFDSKLSSVWFNERNNQEIDAFWRREIIDSKSDTADRHILSWI